MANAPRSYADALTAAHAAIRAGRLNDPGEHFPYKHEQVSALIADNPPMGPDGADDDSASAEDYITQGLADATKVYIDAQAAYLADPGDGTRAEYDSPAKALQVARAAHRVNRPNMVVVGIRARRAGE